MNFLPRFCFFSLLAMFLFFQSSFASAKQAIQLSDDDQSELISDLQVAYRELLVWSKNPENVQFVQRKWNDEHKKKCETENCNEQYKRRIAQLVGQAKVEIRAILKDGVVSSSEADYENIVGSYAGADTAAESIFGHLVIANKKFSWHPSAPNLVCSTNYSIVTKKFQRADLPNGLTNKKDFGYLSFLIEIDPNKCTSNYRYFLLSFSSDLNNSVGVTVLDERSQDIGQIRFYLE